MYRRNQSGSRVRSWFVEILITENKKMLDNLSLVDLKALKKPLVKLIDTLGKGMGMLYQPLFTYLAGKADANRYLTMEKAKTDAEVYRNEALAKSKYILQERVLAREARRQNNIKEVAEIAANELKGQELVSEKPVSKDWITRYINTVEDVSDEELKTIWGKILAGEVKSPGSYSLRTLETLKNLSRKEAELFTKACQYASGYTNHSILVEKNEPDFGIEMNYDEISALMDAGLLLNSFLTSQSFELEDGKFPVVYQEYVILVSVPNKDLANADVLLFTTAANELYPIVGKKLNIDNVRFIASYFKRRKATKVEWAKLKQVNEDGTFTYEDNSIKEL